jgi:micrococcal nuclease
MSTAAKKTIIAAVLAVLAGVIALDRCGGIGLREAIKSRTMMGADGRKYHRKSFTVINIVDGDTVDIDIADGKYKQTRIRLLGVDTPETKDDRVGLMYYGPEATEFVRGVALDTKVTVLLDTVSDQRDRYGRLLAYVLLDSERVLNEEIIRKGFGYADLRFAHSDFDQYENVMDEAIEAEAGLWKDAKREHLPKWLVRKRPGLLRGS